MEGNGRKRKETARIQHMGRGQSNLLTYLVPCLLMENGAMNEFSPF
jgi:hypothetical protein